MSEAKRSAGRPVGSTVKDKNITEKIILSLQKEAKKRGTKLTEFIAKQFFEDREILKIVLNRIVVVPQKADGSGVAKTGIIVIRSDNSQPGKTTAEVIDELPQKPERYKPPADWHKNKNIQVIKNDADI